MIMSKNYLHNQIEQVRKTMNILWEIKTLVDEKFISISTEFDSLLNQYNRITKENSKGI